MGNIPFLEDFTTYLAQAILILFVIVDPVTGMVHYLGHTYSATEEQKKAIARRAVLVTMVVLWFFTFLGNVVLFLLRITVGYIRITGGVYILVYSVRSALFGEGPEEVPDEKTGQKASGLPKRVVDRIAIVPLSIPLLASPGAIASDDPEPASSRRNLLLLRQHLHLWSNRHVDRRRRRIALGLGPLFLSDNLVRRLNPSMLYTLGKVMDILVGAIAISFIIQGVTETFHVTL